MGIFRSKFIPIKFYSKIEIQELQSKGLTPHPEFVLRDIIFISKEVKRIPALDEINYFTFVNGKWKGTDFITMNTLSSIENYIHKYCKKEKIKIGDSFENVYIIKN